MLHYADEMPRILTRILKTGVQNPSLEKVRVKIEKLEFDLENLEF